MDATIMDHRSDPAAFDAGRDSAGPQPMADLPPAAPLDMPVRPLSDWNDAVQPVATAPARIGQRRLIDLLVEHGLRHRFQVMIGGAPTTRAWAEEIGADGYAENANAAVREALELRQKAAP